jgi:hypothetical protein
MLGGPRRRFGRRGDKKIPSPVGTRSPDHPARNPVLYHWAIPAPEEKLKNDVLRIDEGNFRHGRVKSRFFDGNFCLKCVGGMFRKMDCYDRRDAFCTVVQNLTWFPERWAAVCCLKSAILCLALYNRNNRPRIKSLPARKLTFIPSMKLMSLCDIEIEDIITHNSMYARGRMKHFIRNLTLVYNETEKCSLQGTGNLSVRISCFKHICS